MKDKEAKARIKINQMLVDAGWRFFDENGKKANIQLEPNVKICHSQLDDMGEDFEKVKSGFIDYLLLDEQSNPLLVLEAKRSGKHPLDGKEQARTYANSLRVKYVILSNGFTHYFWNLSKGNPEIITSFPTYESLINNRSLYSSTKPLIDAKINKYYIALSQEPSLESTVAWKSGKDDIIENYCYERNLRIMRYYQIAAVRSIQRAVKEGKTRFLFEMATGTGKTLTSAAVIKLFLRSEVVNRCLFFVDRIELENQAMKDFRRYLSKDGIKVVIYKENKDDWNSADVVITTIQSFSVNDKYKHEFLPSDFDLVISDESHRTLGSSNRNIFEYFMGYKLGLTATPKNYLKGVVFDETDPRELEKRVLLDTYHTFGCDNGNATFSYTLLNGVKDGYLINPTIVDARSEVTTQLLSDKGLIINVEDEENATIKEVVFDSRSYEKSFFSESTNKVFCETFLRNALRDPVSGEIGKGILFCVSIDHARKITEILNEIIERMFPGKYNSDFAVQITSNVENAQQMTINFANNNLNGKTDWLEGYESSKTRIAVTVAMMTTGYDCSDILNLGFLRPVFSPSDFIQMKGRGTRTYSFKYENYSIPKTTFKIFDFFAVCEYFENDYNYDEKIEIPKLSGHNTIDAPSNKDYSQYTSLLHDNIISYQEAIVGGDGMKIDRKFYQSFEDKVLNDKNAQSIIQRGAAEELEKYLLDNILDKPSEYFTIKKLEQALGLDRRLGIKEVVQYLLGKIGKIKTKEELLEDEFEKFSRLYADDLKEYPGEIKSIKVLFDAFLTDSTIRNAVREKRLQVLINSPISTEIRRVKDVRIRGYRLMDFLLDYVAANDINCENLAI